MKFFRLSVPEKELTIYPIVCMHIGSPQSDLDFIKQHVRRIDADPNARWVYMGDGGECALKESKGDVYGQTMSPGEQLKTVVDLLEPVRGKGLFGIDGNHGMRIYKATGVNWDEALCAQLGIPYMGASTFMQLRVGENKDRKRAGNRYDIFFHHGKDSSSAIGGKVTAAKGLEHLVEADAVFSAHSHICMASPPTHRATLAERAGTIEWRTMHNYICGCAYDSRTGYAELKAYSPILPGYLSVAFSGKEDSSHQTVTLYRGE